MNFYGADHNFLGISSHHRFDDAEVVILPVPLEQTTSYMIGTAQGPDALLMASHQVELYDDELRSETCRKGIATLLTMEFAELNLDDSLESIRHRVLELIDLEKKPVLIGGEHSLTIGAVRAFHEQYSGLHVLHLDAHADLREAYQGYRNSHASVMARIREMCRFTSVGVRSLSPEESDTIQKGLLDVWDIHRIRRESDADKRIIQQLEGPVYVTIDLDVFDPGVIPNVGTPEPEGMQWREALSFLKQVFENHQVVGIDIVELCPGAGPNYGVFHAAKLVYRLIGYWLNQD